MQKEQIEGFRLSPQQKHIWLLQQSENASPYRVQYAVLITGNLKIENLKTALQNVVNQYEILRTTFYCLPGMTIPLQVIADTYEITITEFNFNGLSCPEQETKIESLFTELKEIPFYLENYPPLQTYIITLSPEKYILMLNLSALLADSSTLKHLINIISNSYSACLQGQNIGEEPMQYADIAEWQNEILESEESELGKEYWRNQDINSIGNLNFWFENKQIEASEFQPQCIYLTIPKNLVKQIESLTHIYNIKKSDFLLVCWLILLWKITRKPDIVISIAGDGRKYEELDEAIGLLSKYLPIFCHLEAEFKFSEILKQVNESANNAYKWQEYFTWEETIKSESCYPVCFEFEEYLEKSSAAELSFSIYKQYSCIERFKIKLTCLYQSDALTVEIHYDAKLYNLQDIQTLSEQFKILLENAINKPKTTISKLNILSDRQLQKLLVQFNNTTVNYPQNKCIHQLFEEQVERTPDQIALVFEQQQLTYAQLNARANQLAHHLCQRGVGPEVLVALYVERSPEIVVGLLGILKAGGAYIALDPAYPQQRLAGMLEDAQVKVLLTQQQLVQTLPQHPAEVICLDTDWEKIAQQSQENPHTEVKSKNLVYVVFTSGSTGKPKGVAVEHRQLLNYLNAILETLDLSTCISFAHITTFAADLGNTAVFPCLCSGGCLHVVSQERASNPEALADYFCRHPIDCLKIVPSHFSALLASSPTQSILPRQRLVLGGEASSWDLIEKIQAQTTNCQIFNHYGPTETTVGILTYLVNNKQNNYNSQTVPLGRPIANVQVYVLDEQLQMVPIGVLGELYIGGSGLARGYLNRPELTAERFIPNPFASGLETRLYKTGDLVRYLSDGNLEFLGRVDHQVKIRGFRIELGEIEATLHQHPAVQEVVVLATEQTLDNKRLVAYIVTNPKFKVRNQNLHSALTNELRSFCLQKLPGYMLPSAFVLLKALPLTPNGKIDRHALPAPEQTRPQLEQLYVEPRTSIEKQLAEIWAEVLGLEQVGIYDNFFELGGHSLLVTQLLAKVRKAFQVELSLRNFFDAPTINNLATILHSEQDIDLCVAQVSIVNLNEEATLDPAIHPANLPAEYQTEPRSILLTGATGFLGAFLLYELLQQTPYLDIYCLIRAETAADAKQRLQDSLESYLLWDDSFARRIIPVVGDLSQPLLGLSDEQFGLMASQIDLIYHNGALVNFTYPYSALKAANVLGTQEVLRLATQIKLKPVHFISTINVATAADSGSHIVLEQDEPEHWEAIANGYAQSKWVSEKLVTIARERGVPVSIYRPGRISGHSQTGVCNTNDHTFRMIRGCIQLGSVPNHDTMVNLIPVDYMSKAIVHLSQQKSSLGKVFHILNPQPLHWSELVNWIQSFGYPLRQIPYEQWQEQLINATLMSTDNALYPLIAIFSESKSAEQTNTEDSTTYQYDCQNTITGLTGTAITCPPLDSKLLSTYFSYLIRSGFLDKP